MNLKKVFQSVTRLLLVEAILLLIPLITAFIYGEPAHIKWSFVISIGLILVVSLPFQFIKVESKKLYATEGFVIVSLAWILMSLFGGIPLYLSGQYSSLVDTFFEISSGFTTTGASVLAEVDHLTHSIIMWKALTQAIGGMGVLVFALAVLPSASKEDIHLMKAESPGPTFGKVVSKIKDSARILYFMYTIITLILIIALVIAGMPLFEAITHAFETAGTGGFSIRNGSVGYYDSVAIELIIGIGMLVYSVNFSLYHLFLLGKAKNFFKAEELRWFVSIVAVAVLLVTLNLASSLGFGQGLRHAFFQVSSMISTTGFSSTDFGTWPLFSQIILLAVMIIGGCAGSTAGGLKVARVATATKFSLLEINKQRNPKRVLKVKFDGKVVEEKYFKTLLTYFALYVMIFGFLLLCISIDLPDFMSAFSAVAATFNNVGPGLGIVGPAASYDMLSDINKILLGIGMIAGRLEIFPLIILFSPRTWKDI